MIFITLGSQKFQFNRLLKEIDILIEDGHITEEVFAQIGYSDYKPKYYKYKEFLDREEFKKIMHNCDKVITHGGTGAIITAIKSMKKVIAIPRLEKYGEHVDNHQIEIIEQFEKMEFIYSAASEKDILKAIETIDSMKVKKYISNTLNIIKSIDAFLQE